MPAAMKSASKPMKVMKVAAKAKKSAVVKPKVMKKTTKMASAMKKKSMAMKKSMKKMAMKKKMATMKKMKKAMKVSIIAKGKRAKSSVFRGTGSKVKTSGGLTKSDLKLNKAGKVVSLKASNAAKKKSGYKKIAKWGSCFALARKSLGIKGFVACGGKTKLGQQLLAKTRSLYRR